MYYVFLERFQRMSVERNQQEAEAFEVRFVESVRYNILDWGTCLLLFNHKVYVQ